MFRAVAALSFAILGLSACNPVANLDDAEQKIESFEKVYNAGDLDRLYKMTGEEFQEVTSVQDFENLYRVFDARLGKVNGSERVNFNVASMNGVTQTVIVMDSNFEQGDGVQTFTFHGSGDDMELVGWQVNSPRLSITVDDLEADAAGAASEGF